MSGVISGKRRYLGLYDLDIWHRDGVRKIEYYVALKHAAYSYRYRCVIAASRRLR